ncbi:MAG: hypothetical protein JNK07_19675 [Alphaproteobacteria bacterium]|nr:hypothetical protein [Alphaproteobacteria bacterium]
MRGLTLFALATALLVGTTTPGSTKLAVLDATDKCEARDTCLDFDVLATGEVPFADVLFTRQNRCGVHTLKVKGRLGGGSVRDYVIAIQANCMECSLGTVAYLGRSAANNPLIRTRSGALEVVDSGLRIGTADDLRVIDVSKGDVVASYIGNFSAAVDFVFDRGEVFMRHDDGLCFAAPRLEPGLLRQAPGRCERPDGDAFTAYGEASAKTKAVISKLVQPDAYELVTLRPIPGTKLVAMQVGDNCYQ